MTALPTIHGRDLPPLAYAHTTDHDPALTRPETFRTVIPGGGFRPTAGGLWTSPVTARHRDGTPALTLWVDWWRSEELPADRYSHLTEIMPVPTARVLLIDSADALRSVVEAHPMKDSGLVAAGFGGRWPEWASICDAGFDAVYVTKDGPFKLEHAMADGPDLYGWDCATVLFLRPVYTVGRTVVAVPAATECEVA